MISFEHTETMNKIKHLTQAKIQSAIIQRSKLKIASKELQMHT